MPDAITAQCLIMREGSTNIDYFNLVLHYPDKVATLHSDLYSADAEDALWSIKLIELAMDSSRLGKTLTIT